MALPRLSISARTLVVAAAGLAATLALAAPARQVRLSPTYTIIGTDARRPVPFRTAGNADLLPLDLLAEIFGLTLREDPVAGGLTVTARSQRIGLTAGQALVSVGGRLVSLSGAVTREGRGWSVPADFLSRALAPALGIRIDVRRASHLVIVGDARVPQIMPTVERQGSGARVVVETDPPTAHRVTRDGSRLVVQFEADALDAAPLSGSMPEFLTGAHTDRTTLILDLGPLTATFRVTDDRDGTQFTIDLLPPGAARPPVRPPPPQELPTVVEPASGGPVRTIVIDPGHGGDDAGVHGPGGTLEKDVTLQIARRLKAAIEGRIGLRVLLTRDGDDAVTADRRTELANNNQADIFISLHANASLRSGTRGAQVLSLSLEDYKDRAQVLGTNSPPVPLATGGSRTIEVVPWELAQIRHVARSAALATIVIRQLTEQAVPLYLRPGEQAPLRVLSGANMPAVLVEMGFLSSAEDERALTSDEMTTAIVNALVGTIVDVKNGLLAAVTSGPVRR